MIALPELSQNTVAPSLDLPWESDIVALRRDFHALKIIEKISSGFRLRQRVREPVNLCDLRLLFVVALLLFSSGGVTGGSLLRGLLLLLVVLLLCRSLSDGLFQDLEDLLILNLLVRLDLAQVQGWRASQLGDAVLGNGYWQR